MTTDNSTPIPQVKIDNPATIVDDSLPSAPDNVQAAAAAVDIISDMMERLKIGSPDQPEEWRKGVVSTMEVAHRAAVFYTEALLSGSAPVLQVGKASDENDRPLYIKMTACDEVNGRLATRTERVTEFVMSDRARIAMAKLTQHYPDQTVEDLIDNAIVMAEPQVQLVRPS